MPSNSYKKILFSGGGTLGPVMPLLAVWDVLRAQKQLPLEALWVCTPQGPERALLEKEGLRTRTLHTPKLRRYASLYTLLLPFSLVWSCLRAWFLLRRERPDVVVTAGGYTSLPIHLMAHLLRIRSFVHQQDLEPGLTNRILAPLATSLTVAFPETVSQFKTTAVAIGNPVREDIAHPTQKGERFHLEPGVPTLLVLGGGVGATSLNRIVWDALPELTKYCQVIHSTGAGKENQDVRFPRYHAYAFIDRAALADAYAVALLVVARAGMGTLTELAALRKPAILAPIVGSHQEANARAAVEKGAALRWGGGSSRDFIEMIKAVLHDPEACARMSDAWRTVLRTDAANRLAMMILYALGRRVK